MPPDDHRARRLAAHHDPLVAGGIHLGAQALIGEPAVEPLPGLPPHGTPRDTLGAVGIAGPVGQLSEIDDDVSRAQGGTSRVIIVLVRRKTTETVLDPSINAQLRTSVRVFPPCPGNRH